MQVKIYECPQCGENFTTAKVKRNNNKCPACDVPLKHDIDRSGGAMVHMWIIDDSVPLVILTPEDAEEPKFEKISERGDVPEVYRRIKPPSRELDPEYRVVYMDRYGSTDVRCPVCGSYLHTTNAISGSKEQDFCRSNYSDPISGDWVKKCKTRTEFWFFKQGEVFDAAFD